MRTVFQFSFCLLSAGVVILVGWIIAAAFALAWTAFFLWRQFRG